MSNKTYNKYNFHNHTFCVFQEVDLEAIQNLKLDFKSKSGSSYYFNSEGVYRFSNHWGRAANCKWRLIPNKSPSSNRDKLAFASWSSFHEDNDMEKLYGITVDFHEKTATYIHKNSQDFNPNSLLRTASDSTKIIKQIRNLFANDSWAKYFENANLQELRMQIIEKLIATNLSLQEIKSEIRSAL